MQQLNVRISDDADRYLRKQARKRGISRYQYGQDLIEKAIFLDQIISEKLDLLINTTIQAYAMSAVQVKDKDPELYEKGRQQARDAIKRLREES
ncbi:hypothetical protein [Endozoicomonas sp. ONNA1]|uniref:hypothetical protein n=1 Tax=Endozoicomonas sp. ONNA1 TaxID=2828740 RepID=UPI0021492AA9|nr:hypothetical protein [Endozoicomonas sp. ONNA1]